MREYKVLDKPSSPSLATCLWVMAPGYLGHDITGRSSTWWTRAPGIDPSLSYPLVWCYSNSGLGVAVWPPNTLASPMERPCGYNTFCCSKITGLVSTRCLSQGGRTTQSQLCHVLEDLLQLLAWGVRMCFTDTDAMLTLAGIDAGRIKPQLGELNIRFVDVVIRPIGYQKLQTMRPIGVFFCVISTCKRPRNTFKTFQKTSNTYKKTFMWYILCQTHSITSPGHSVMIST